MRLANWPVSQRVQGRAASLWKTRSAPEVWLGADNARASVVQDLPTISKTEKALVISEISALAVSVSGPKRDFPLPKPSEEMILVRSGAGDIG